MQLQLHLSPACNVGHHLHSFINGKSFVRAYVHGHRWRHVCRYGSAADPTALLARLSLSLSFVCLVMDLILMVLWLRHYLLICFKRLRMYVLMYMFTYSVGQTVEQCCTTMWVWVLSDFSWFFCIWYSILGKMLQSRSDTLAVVGPGPAEVEHEPRTWSNFSNHFSLRNSNLGPSPLKPLGVSSWPEDQPSVVKVCSLSLRGSMIFYTPFLWQVGPNPTTSLVVQCILMVQLGPRTSPSFPKGNIDPSFIVCKVGHGCLAKICSLKTSFFFGLEMGNWHELA